LIIVWKKKKLPSLFGDKYQVSMNKLTQIQNVGAFC